MFSAGIRSRLQDNKNDRYLLHVYDNVSLRYKNIAKTEITTSVNKTKMITVNRIQGH